MAQTLKEYLQQKGMPSDVALQVDEVAAAIHNRMFRFNKTGVVKHLILIDIGKYRHMETKTPKSTQELLRVTLDGMQLVTNFEDRFKILEHYKIIRLNYVTAEYEFTDFGKTFFPQRAELKQA